MPHPPAATDDGARATPLPPLPPAAFPPLPPGPPPPLPPNDAPPSSLLTQIFRDQNAALACQHMLMLSPHEAGEELSAAFSAVDWAPHVFLLALTHWPATAPRNVFFSLVVVGTDCMNERLQQAQTPPSPVVSDLAGALLLDAFHDCRAHACAAFISAFNVSVAHLHAHCVRLLHEHVKVAVTVLDLLNQRALLPLDVVVAAAVRQNDLEAADAFVRDDPALQRTYLQMLINGSLQDKAINKRLNKFNISDQEFPAYHARRVRATIRFLVHNQQFEDILALVEGRPELSLYACQFVVSKRGCQDLVSRLFVHRSGHADKDDFAYIDTTSMADATFPNKDDLEPLASCLSIAELGGECVFVGTPEALAECVVHLREAPVVGFDCEWKSATVRGQEAEACAVLQVASATRAFVIDTIALKHQCGPLREIFSSASIVKLGFDTKGDLSVLAKVLPESETASMPHKNCDGSLVRNLVDVQALAKRLNSVKQPHQKSTDAASLEGDDELEEGEILEDGEATTGCLIQNADEKDTTGQPNEQGKDGPEAVDVNTGPDRQEAERPSSAADAATKRQRKYKGKKKQKWKGSYHPPGAAADGAEQDSQSVSLAAVAEQYLGKPLDKRSRMSDWERRPLTRAQLHYAAMDALVLVAVFDLMRGRFPELEFSHAVAQLSRHRGPGSARVPTPKTLDVSAATVGA